MSTESKEEALIIEEVSGAEAEGNNGFAVTNIILPTLRVDNVRRSNKNKYWLRLSDRHFHWVEENDLERALLHGFIPAVGKPRKTTTVKIKDSVDEMECSSNRPTSVIRFLCRNIKDPKIDARNPVDSDEFHAYDISMLIISCKSIGQFMEEVQAFLPGNIKTGDAMDWKYLDDPEHKDTAYDVKIKTWYVRMRAKCKVILSKLNLCYGGLQKNGYQFFLTTCYTKEFGKPEASKKTNTTVNVNNSNNESKDEAIKDLNSNTMIPQVEISFTEEVNNG